MKTYQVSYAKSGSFSWTHAGAVVESSPRSAALRVALGMNEDVSGFIFSVIMEGKDEPTYYKF